MRIAYLECFSGISGDMFLGALVDAGVPLALLQETVRALDVGAEITASKVDRNGIAATKVDVIVNGERDVPREEFWAAKHQAEGHAHEHGHSHEHTHGGRASHSHGHAHEHAPDGKAGHHHSHEHGHSHSHRGLKEIREIIQRAHIPEDAKKTALLAFELLGRAEAKIHNKDLESVHFHEVGAIDAIVDITCGAVAAHSLQVDQWVCSPLNVGSGVVHCAHGTLPVPAPATLELLREAPVYSGEVQKELVTPTGAALVRALVSRFGAMPPMQISGAGYGAGSRDFKGLANVLRITIGEAAASGLGAPQESVTVLEANLDDTTPQVIGHAIDRLLDAGALDVFATPVQMKKNRPGTVLTVLARNEDTQRMAELVFRETTTIGLRMRQEWRHTLAREHVQVATPWGDVRVKVARLGGRDLNFAPEFEDCKRIAEQSGVPLKTVMQEAVRSYLDQHSPTATRGGAAVGRHHG
ncbi:MAG TPA: nickel pincer cofactor biosynthesis protein LarC [Clostridia bacterium]|nr:nickel pincer cofactor biosynthesis protein LarC [Clostridia bacterium]